MKRISLALFCAAVLVIVASPAFSFMGINYSPFHYPARVLMSVPRYPIASSLPICKPCRRNLK